MASFIQVMAQRVCRGYRFGQTGLTQVWFADDSAYLCEDLAGLQMALDAMWVVSRVAGLKVTVKAKDAETRVGSKTAWMGTYWDAKGKEQEVTGWKVELPDGTVVPQVRAYKYLGTPLQIEYEGRHDAMRKKVVGTCCALIRQIGRVDMLGPRQLRRGFELAMAGVLGYYCRSTPMTWKCCQQIEAVRAEVLARRGICASTPRAAIYLPGEAGGAGHMHAYQYAAAAYMDQFHRALGGGLGEPVRTAVSERVAATCRCLGCTQAPLTWHPVHLMNTLSEDHMVEAWLLMKLRAQMRGVRSGAMVHTSLGDCGACNGWRGRAPGSGQSCEVSWCPGSKMTGAEDIHMRATAAGSGQHSQNWEPCSDPKGRHCSSREYGQGGAMVMGSRGAVSRARRTADCFGGWEYLVHDGHAQHGVWVHHFDMPKETGYQAQLEEAQKKRQSHSLRDLIETEFGCVARRSVGRMEVAISGLKSHDQTEARLAELVNAFITHAQDQMASEMGKERWPNLDEMPQKDGYRGSEWVDDVKPTISYYRGGRQTLPDGGKRSCMSLDGRPGTWEERLPANLQVTKQQVETVLGSGGAIPEGGVHQHVNHRRPQPPGTGPWSDGGGQAGYTQINHAGLRYDPVTRLFLRHRAFERGAVTVRTTKGIQITCGEVNQAALYEEPHARDRGQAQGDVESMEALVDVCLPLHYSVRFTHAAAVDGSMDDPRRRGGKGKKRVAYGVFEGIRPEAEMARSGGDWGTHTQTERELRCLGSGLWGGALPRDWDNNDAEAYAIMRYLQSVVEKSEDPSVQRVLVLSDSRAVLDVIESVWRTGDAALCKSRDRGAMIEATCEARRQLQQVVFTWCPGHRGIVPNEYADMAAKAHLDAHIDSDATKRIADNVRMRDCLYEIGSEHDEDSWSLADRRCFRLARQIMGRWVQGELMSSVRTLRYDDKMANGRRYNYGEGGYCTEIVKDFGEGRTVTPKSGIDGMLSDCGRVGFVMGRRARDSGLPHERGYFRRLGHDLPEDDEEAGNAQEWEEECRTCDTGKDRLSAAQRERRQGCPGCPRHIGNACDGCGGWLGRPAGSAPACRRQDCPGATDSEGWTIVHSRRRHVTLRIPAAQARREELKRNEDPHYSIRTHGDAQGGEGGGRSARTRQAQTTTERLRREGGRTHEDSRFDIGPSNPLADLSHVIGGCSGTPNRLSGLQHLAFAIQDLRETVPAGRGDTQEFRDLMSDAGSALNAAHNGQMQTGDWESADRVLAAMVPDFARDATEGKRAGLVKAVIGSLGEVHLVAAGMLGAWKRTHAAEIKRRDSQERARGLMRLIVRAWREETDGRKARSLRGAKDNRIEMHAPSRMPTDCLPTETTSVYIRVPRTATVKEEAQLRRKKIQQELKCEGGREVTGCTVGCTSGLSSTLTTNVYKASRGGKTQGTQGGKQSGSANPFESKGMEEQQCGARTTGGMARTTCELAEIRPVAGAGGGASRPSGFTSTGKGATPNYEHDITGSGGVVTGTCGRRGRLGNGAVKFTGRCGTRAGAAGAGIREGQGRNEDTTEV